MTAVRVVSGLERLLQDPALLGTSGRLGLLYNQASVDALFRPAPELIAQAFPGRLRVLFGPQHGAAMTEQDNMIETGHSVHPRLGLPLYSLYAESRTPRRDMLESVDTVLIDLQDVGTRVYTFATTALELMKACAQAEKDVLVLDRPNPLNGVSVEGNVLHPDFSSFVGPYPLPMRHGLTLGELLTLYNEEYGIGARLKVIRMDGWNRRMYFEDTGLPWVLPSPNMPTVETAVVYPGQVILEGTNLSEGRGTTRPFELFGAPYVDARAVRAALESDVLDGAILREVAFRPTFNKWAGQVCHGFQIHVTDRTLFRPYRCSLGLVSAIFRTHPESFRWADPPYEYVYDKKPFDVIVGDARIREGLEAGCTVHELEASWHHDLAGFHEVAKRYCLYP